ncbi:MAG: glycine/betaine ABC transporter substrate-binding protein [Actinomycetota bacterium]|nr:glycine/betaine ABC transporter substrate-binding protein [Actinomycetota bacterium]
MSSTIRMILAVLSAALLSLGVAACGDDEGDTGGSESAATGSEGELIESDPANEGVEVTIGSKNFTEQYILGNVYAQALEAAGFDVSTELDLGSEQIAYRAVQEGQIDGYPEYTGTSLTSFFDYKTADVPTDAEEAYDLVVEEYAKQDITALAMAPFNNTFVVTSTPETAEEFGATTLSDVAEAEGADEASIAGFPECRQRTDCLLGLRDVYGWEPEFVSTEAKFEPLDNDQADFVFGFGTDGELSLDKYQTYEDDQGLFPPYNPAVTMRNDAVERIGPAGVEVIERVQEPMTEEVMRELNARVDLDKEKPEDVATQYLQESGFIE